MQIVETNEFSHYDTLAVYMYAGAEKREIQHVYVAWQLVFHVYNDNKNSKKMQAFRVACGIRNKRFVWGTVDFVSHALTVPKTHVDYLTKSLFGMYCKYVGGAGSEGQITSYYNSDAKVYTIEFGNETKLSLTDAEIQTYDISVLDSDPGSYAKGGWIPPPWEAKKPDIANWSVKSDMPGDAFDAYFKDAKVQSEPLPLVPISSSVWIKSQKIWRWVCYYGDTMYESLIPGEITTGEIRYPVGSEKWPEEILRDLKKFVQCNSEKGDMSNPQSLANGFSAVHPVTKNKSTLQSVIISLNDEHKWSRKRIADWLDTLDEQPTFYKKEPVSLTATVVTLKPSLLEGASG